MNQTNFDAIVIGGGVMGCSIAYHLAREKARVLLLEREGIGQGTTAQSSCILRTHYSVPQNVTLAQAAWRVYADFAAYLDDPEADCGLVKCGYLIAAPDGDKVEPLRVTLAAQRAQGIRAEEIDAVAAAKILPIARFDDAALIGYEPEAGFADAWLVTSSFARGARRFGAVLREGVAVTGLLRAGARVTGVQTAHGDWHAGVVISAINIWSHELAQWSGINLPLTRERHAVMTFDCAAAPYTRAMPVFKDLGAPGLIYCRSYGGAQMLASEGLPGTVLDAPDTTQADVPMDTVLEVGAQVAQRFPAYADAGLASSWTGVYDVTPDWNPVLGPVPGLEGLFVAYGFSGHGFKLAPAVGRLLAQAALAQPTDLPLAPFALERFAAGRALRGRYGAGAVS